MKLGDRVIWRSSSHRWWTEKVGIVIFMGKGGGWKPERPPRDGWLKPWRQTIKRRRPEYQTLCDLYPGTGGGYRDPNPRGYWTSRSRYRFDKCTSGVLVAVSEMVQLNPDTEQHTFKRPKRPVFYAPSDDAWANGSKLVVWPEGEPRPEFDVPEMVLKPAVDPVVSAKQEYAAAEQLIRNARILANREVITLLSCQGGTRVPPEDWKFVERLVEIGYLRIMEGMRYAEPTLAGTMLIRHIQAIQQDGVVVGNLNIAVAMLTTEMEKQGGFDEVLSRPAVKDAVESSRAYMSAALGLGVKTG